MRTRRRLPLLAGTALLAGLLASLLAAGGTYALWGTDDTVAGGTITAGNLDITMADGYPVWNETSSDVSSPQQNLDPQEFEVRQGDTFEVIYQFTTDLQGANMRGELSVDWPDGVEIPTGMTGTYELADSDGNSMMDNGPVDIGDSTDLSGHRITDAGNAGTTDEFTLKLNLDFAGLDDRFGPGSDVQLADFGNIDVILDQKR